MANYTLDYTGQQINTKLSKAENTDNKVTSLSSSSTNTEYPGAKLVYDQLGLKLNSPEISSITTNNDGWYNSGTQLTGTVELIGDMCIIRGYAGLPNNWGEVWYSLPVAAAQGSACVAANNGIMHQVYTDVKDNISVMNIKKLNGGNLDSGTLHFVLIYRYQ